MPIAKPVLQKKSPPSPAGLSIYGATVFCISLMFFADVVHDRSSPAAVRRIALRLTGQALYYIVTPLPDFSSGGCWAFAPCLQSM